MKASLFHSAAGNQVPVEPELIAQLQLFDESYQQDTLALFPIQQALSVLETKHREDLMDIWAERAYHAHPDHPFSLYAMAMYYDRVGLPQSSIPLWIAFGQKKPDFDPLGLQLANALLHNGNLEEAKIIGTHALALFSSGTHIDSGVGNAAVYCLKFHLLMSEILLRLGDPSGFHHHAAHLALRIPHYPLPDIPRWNPAFTQLNHLLITPVGGYGDQLLYCALIPTIAPHFMHITIAVHPDLFPLFVQAFPQFRIIACPSATSLNAAACAEITAAIAEDRPTLHVPMLALPVPAFELAPSRPLLFESYLHSCNFTDRDITHAIERVQTRYPQKILVGIAWDRTQRYSPEIVGGNEACRTARTSLPMTQLQALLEDEDIGRYVHFIALHETDANRNWPTEPHTHFSPIPINSGNFSQTTQVMRACDLVVSVDMSVANLAAMLNIPVWVLLAREGDWRWGHTGTTTPWIPQARTFRQTEPGNWDSVLAQVRSALHEHFRAKLPTHTNIVD